MESMDNPVNNYLLSDVDKFKKQSNSDPDFDRWAKLNLIGSSLVFRKTLSLINNASSCDAPVFLEGETGIGKEITARAIHYLGARCDSPFSLENTVGRECRVQSINSNNVAGKIAVTLTVMRLFPA